jgi:hypothetical protein
MLTKKLMGAGGAGGAGGAAGAWTFVNQGLSYTEEDQTVNVSDWGLIEHDLLLYSYAGRSASTSPPFTPTQSGFSVQISNGARTVHAWYFVPATPPTTITVNNDSGDGILLVQAWRHTTGTALALAGYSATPDSGGGMPDPPSVTNAYTDVLVVAFGGIDRDPVTDVTAPSGYSNLYDEYDQEKGAHTAMLASKVVTTTSTEDPAAFGGSGDDDWSASTVLFRVA